MFNDEKIAALERRVSDLESATKVSVDCYSTQPIATIIYLLLHHLKLRCVVATPRVELKEIGNEKA